MGGLEGVWYPTDFARCVLRDIAILEGRTIELDKVQRKFEESTEQVGSMKRAALTWDEQEKAMELMIKAQDSRIDDLESAWRSPWLWLGVGVVVGGAGIIAVGASI